ncbi:D-serine ammonia-lyase [Methylobacterium phyllostachyos]|uniref:Probable D-serine dehydratase n=1 Tax=Methylobacterium phyllostachyos TaxID=582672 RepID=A0A1H0C6F1_9HYPH|nr:D-serine ammonia-lyase [Methylobacterium phyllostachyos]SDN53439.1 D-serine ammonia-lyase [Methylobacterium phyllostachyos]
MDVTARPNATSREQAIPAPVRRAEPIVWRNPHRRDAASVLAASAFSAADMRRAEARWRRFDPLLAQLFEGTQDGRIDSPLLPVPSDLAGSILGDAPGSVWVKADHDLPVTGCIKARGGVYEVLAYAEMLAGAAGFLRPGLSYAAFASGPFRDLFARHVVAVGSTGNLGFSVGVMARALGFQVEVHMSHDAKAWKKQRLRALGAHVVEHPGDYGLAVAAARAAFSNRTDAHFVDDENSVDLFLGYAAAALDLQRQLATAGIAVDAAHPLYVYLPCGVGGAPGGVAFGLTLLFGDAVRPVFVEPVASPCMLVQLASGLDRPVSVYEAGLDNRTAADGLAVASASMLVARTVGELVDAVVTVTDAELFRWLKALWNGAGMRLEPSAASGFAALGSFLAGVPPSEMAQASHVVWTTGGAHLPDQEFEAALARA